MGLHRLIVAFVLAGILLPASTLCATESLYRRENATTLPKSKWSVYLGPKSVYFGPKSAGIRYDKRMINAARIAQARARSYSISRCWRYVKTALVDAKVINSYPKTRYAKQAGDELTREHGFKKLPTRNPFAAPLGAVIVYGGKGAGHVEIRTERGFVSDFVSRTPSPRPVVGVYVKPS